MRAEFLCVLHATRREMLTAGPTPEEDELIRQHFRYFEALMQQGHLLLAGRPWMPDPRTFGVAILRAANQTAAEALMAADPAVREGAIQVEVHPFEVVLLASAWATA